MISVKEFNDFIASFNKQPGEYTEDEIYAIGVKHKDLPQGERDWADLCHTLGVNKSSEALRSWINSRQLKDGTLPKNTNVISERTVEDIKDQELVEKTQILFKQQQKTRDERNAYRRAMREDARVEEFKDLIKEVASNMGHFPRLAYRPTNTIVDGTEAILMVSDLHIGVNCDNFYNKYNKDVAMNRMAKVVDDTKRYCKLHNVQRLSIVNLGDLVQGIIHTNARIEATMNVVEEIMVASEIMSNVLYELQDVAPEVIYRSCVDNHSRAVADLHQSIEGENFNKIVDWYLEERLKDTSIAFAHDNLSDEIGKFTLMNGKKVMFAHGHNDNINSSFSNFIGATQEFIDYVLLAHFHSAKAKTFQNITVVVNGSVVGTEQYAMSKRLFGKPSQTLLVFDGDNLINYTMNLENA